MTKTQRQHRISELIDHDVISTAAQIVARLREEEPLPLDDVWETFPVLKQKSEQKAGYLSGGNADRARLLGNRNDIARMIAMPMGKKNIIGFYFIDVCIFNSRITAKKRVKQERLSAKFN